MRYKFPLAAGSLLAASLVIVFSFARRHKTAAVNYVGQISATYSVDANGNGNYTVPIQTGPGISGVSPSLSVNYNTIQEDGIMGVGWKLLGLSEITRVAATQAQDGFFGYVNYDTTDRYAVDGQRLQLVQGSYSGDSAVFHTEVESWSRVVAYKGCGTGFCSFQVYMKNGLVRSYTPVAMATGTTNVRCWGMTKITDRNGNFMTIDYLQDAPNSSYYPQTITYTQHVGISQYHYVRFAYEARPDSVATYQGGVMVKYNRRLKTIQAFTGNTASMSYTVNYAQGISTGKTQVSSITQCASDGGCLNPTTVFWQGQNASFYNPASGISAPNVSALGTNLPMDVNGDGLIDYVHAWQGQGNVNNKLMISVFLSNGSGFNTPNVINTGLSTYTNYVPLRAMDVNGDGMIDLVYAAQSSSNLLMYSVMLSNGTGFNIGKTDTTNIPAFSMPNNIVGTDINGDGMSDLVFPSQSKTNLLQYQVLLSSGKSFTPQPMVTTGLKSYTNFPNIVPAHINNDPLEDLAYGYSTGSPKLIVAPLISTGTGYNTTLPPLATDSAVDQYTHLMPADMNGDGLSDLVISWQNGAQIRTGVFYSNGINFIQSANTYNQPRFPVQQGTIIPMEINGDGRTDLMYSYADKSMNMQLTPFISNGTTFVAQPNLPAPGLPWSQYGLVPADVNGDAKSDMVNIGGTTSAAQITQMLATQPFPDLVDSITNGLGGKVAMSYAPLTNASVYTKMPVSGSLLGINNVFNHLNGAVYAAGVGTQGVFGGANSSFPVVNTVVPLYVVASYTQYDGVGGAYPYSFRYAGARIDLSGHGWLGFSSKTMMDVNSNTIDSTNYNQLFPLTGKVLNSLKMRLSDKVLLERNRSLFTQAQAVPGAPNVWQVLQATTRTDHYTYGSFDYTIGNNYKYDPYGNITLLTELNDTSKPQNIAYTIQSYNYDPVHWQLGILVDKKLASDSLGNNLLQHTATSFDPVTWEVLSESRWVSNNNWVRQDYINDAYGNRTNIIYNHLDTTTIVYDNTYHTFPAAVISPPNMQGKRLTETYNYHPFFGKLLSKTDANGNTTATVYNGMGATVATLGPDPNGKMDTLTTSFNVAVPGGGYYTQTNILTSWTTGAAQWVRNYMDGIDRVHRIMSEATDSSQVKITDRILDSKARVVRETVPYFQGSPASSILWTSQSYDAYGRMVRMTTPVGNTDSSVTLISYPDGYTANTLFASGTKDSSRTIQRFAYIKSTRSLVQCIDATKGVTSYQYDILNRVTSSIDPLGDSSLIAYDGIDERTQMKDHTHGTTKYVYDHNQRSVQQQYNNGKSVTTFMDARWRVVKSVTSDKDSSWYLYDNPATLNGLGELSSVSMANGASYQYAYDAYGNRSAIALNFKGQQYISGQTYTPNHLLDKMTYPDGSVLQYGYTAEGIIQSMSLDDATDGVKGNFVPCVTYSQFNATGNPQMAKFGNQVNEAFGWYNNGLVRTHSIKTTDGKTAVQDTFSWNYLARIQKINSGIDTGLNQSFGYDAAGRLTSARMINGLNTYKYDAGGNMWQKNQQKFGYNDYFLKYATQGSDTLFTAAYDGVGNMTRKQKGDSLMEYSYTAAFNLASVKLNGKLSSTFLYDYNNNRLLKNDTASKTSCLYVSPTYLITVNPDGSIVHTKYVCGPSGMVASINTTNQVASKWIRQNRVKGVNAMGSTGGRNNMMSHLLALTSDPQFANRITWGMLGLLNLALLSFFFYHYWRNNFQGRSRKQLARSRFWTRLPKAQWLIPFIVVVMTLQMTGFTAYARPSHPQAPTGAITYFHQNLVNSTTVTTNVAGTVQTMLSYLPYGTVYQISGPDNVRFKFTNKELDVSSQLYYFNARYYDPDMCRFISADSQLGGSINQADIFNAYAYTLNNPVNYTDPSGHGIFSWLASLIVDILEIVVGVVIEAVSEGSLTVLAQTLIGAGINGGIYSATHYSNFSWKDWGIQQAIGGAMGLGFAGLGAVGDVVGNAIKGGSEAAGIGTSEIGSSLEGRLCMREVGSNEQMVFQEVEMDGASVTNAQCFVAGTLIAVEKGEKPIENIKEGDRVWSYNEATGTAEVQHVVKLFRKTAKHKVTISIGATIIETTLEHPFWQKSKGWTPAKDLKTGDQLFTLGTKEVLVTEVKITEVEFTVYNFEVSKTHTYYVSGNQVLVHNQCYTPSGNAYDVEVQISRQRWPESASHIEDAQNAGHDEVLTIDRGGASQNRREWQSLGKYPTRTGFDRDEYPPAMFQEGGADASIRYISPSDNRSCGSFFGNFLRWTNGGSAYPNGTRVWFNVVP
jgi:RHS repeat-associated protein